MHKILSFIFLHTIIFPSDLIVDIRPDTIFVGSLVKILVKVENNNKEETAIFYDLDENVEYYTLFDKILTHNSVEYILQFWNAGDIIIPPIIVDIQRSNLNIRKLKTDEIKLIVLTNISAISFGIDISKPFSPVYP